MSVAPSSPAAERRRSIASAATALARVLAEEAHLTGGRAGAAVALSFLTEIGARVRLSDVASAPDWTWAEAADFDAALDALGAARLTAALRGRLDGEALRLAADVIGSGWLDVLLVDPRVAAVAAMRPPEAAPDALRASGAALAASLSPLAALRLAARGAPAGGEACAEPEAVAAIVRDLLATPRRAPEEAEAA
jgi:hypothetical protein